MYFDFHLTEEELNNVILSAATFLPPREGTVNNSDPNIPPTAGKMAETDL